MSGTRPLFFCISVLLQAKNFFILCLLRLAQGSADAANCVPDHISLHTAGTQAPAKGEYVARSFAPSLQAWFVVWGFLS